MQYRLRYLSLKGASRPPSFLPPRLTDRLQLTDVAVTGGASEEEALALAASAERDSEHPLAEAVRAPARTRGLPFREPQAFEALPGVGVGAQVDGRTVTVARAPTPGQNPPGEPAGARVELPEGVLEVVRCLQAEGKTVMVVAGDGRVVGALAAADRLRPEVPQAIHRLKAFGIRHLELLTGDHERVAASVARGLGIGYRANRGCPAARGN